MIKGENDKAITEFEKALKLDNKMSATYANYAHSLAIAGRFEDADIALDRAKELNFKNADMIEEKINNLKNKPTSDN